MIWRRLRAGGRRHLDAIHLDEASYLDGLPLMPAGADDDHRFVYLSVDANTRWSVETYVRSCCPGDGWLPSDQAMFEVTGSVARELCANLLDVAPKWAPAASSRLSRERASGEDGAWALNIVERRLRAAGFKKDEVDALYQHVSETAERPEQRALVARRLIDMHER